VSCGSVRHSMALLRKAGLVKTMHGRGTFALRSLIIRKPPGLPGSAWQAQPHEQQGCRARTPRTTPRRTMKPRMVTWISVGLLGTLLAVLAALSQEAQMHLNINPLPVFSSLRVPDPGVLGHGAPLP
jgi:hypothetical protein